MVSYGWELPESRTGNGSANTGQTFLYFGWLTLFVYLATPTGYLVDIQTSYMLKNQLHATATQISMFRLVTAIPVYFAFAFGLMRDLWNPFGLRDRGFFLIFAPATAAAFIWMASVARLLPGLLIGMLLAMLSSRFIAAAYQGLMALVGQEKLMSGRLSVLWNVVSSLPFIAGAFASGYISEHLPPEQRPSCWWRHSLLASPCWGSGSRVPSSAIPTTNRRPGARISWEMSGGW